MAPSDLSNTAGSGAISHSHRAGGGEITGPTLLSSEQRDTHEAVVNVVLSSVVAIPQSTLELLVGRPYDRTEAWEAEAVEAASTYALGRPSFITEGEKDYDVTTEIDVAEFDMQPIYEEWCS